MKHIGAAFNLDELKQRITTLRSQMPNSMSSNSNRTLYQCEICQDTGTINEYVKIDSGYRDKEGGIIYFDALKVDAKGNLPLCECYQEKIFAKYNATAGMKPNEQLRTFEGEETVIDEENKFAYVQARNFVKHIEEHLKEGTWLYIHGDPFRAREKGTSGSGTGKSYLTHCIGNKLTEMKQRAIYVTEDKLFEEIRATYNKNSDETESQVMYKYQNVPILLIDDLFKSKITEWVEDKLFHLLNNRLRPGMVTIINSNFAPNRIEEQMPKNGVFVQSRIIGQAVLLEMIGKDRRRGIAKKRMQDLMNNGL